MSTPDFFRSRLGVMIDLHHPPLVLARYHPARRVHSAVDPRGYSGRLSVNIKSAGPTIYQRKLGDRGATRLTTIIFGCASDYHALFESISIGKLAQG